MSEAPKGPNRRGFMEGIGALMAGLGGAKANAQEAERSEDPVQELLEHGNAYFNANRKVYDDVERAAARATLQGPPPVGGNMGGSDYQDRGPVATFSNQLTWTVWETEEERILAAVDWTIERARVEAHLAWLGLQPDSEITLRQKDEARQVIAYIDTLKEEGEN